ncbi:MAG TPA: hypothetical protein VM287_07945 [Egibacteraceae bacterium]|nr:hypothetical protein [Egibacteraceae bacterium]
MAWDGSFDLQYHLLLADHYRASWFAAWEPRWYGGFFVYCYPPLAHQLLALLGAFLGPDGAARVLGALVLGGLVFALARLASIVAGDNAPVGATIIALGWTAPWLFLLVWGQLPAVVSLLLALLACGSLVRYLDGANARDLVLWALLAGSSAAAHHQTGFFLVPLLLLVGVGTSAVKSRLPSVLLRRATGAAALAALCCLVVYVPHLWWLITQDLPQAPIPHPSRSNYFADPFLFSIFFVGVWGLAAVIVPFALVHGARNRRMWAIVAGAVLCGILSFGTLTPLPRVLFPGWWEWLTYERFGLWSSALTVVLGGSWLRNIGRELSLVMLLCAGATGIGLLFGVVLPARPHMAQDAVVENARQFLAKGSNGDWRYLTLGFGENRLSRLSRLTSATTVDGFYFMARRDPVLRASGIGTIDGALQYRRGIEVVEHYLRVGPAQGVRWVLSMDPRWEARLVDRGWSFLECAGTGPRAASTAECVQVWEAPRGSSVPTAAEVQEDAPAVPAGLALVWGVMPLAELVTAGAIAAGPGVQWVRVRFARRRSTCQNDLPPIAASRGKDIRPLERGANSTGTSAARIPER